MKGLAIKLKTSYLVILAGCISLTAACKKSPAAVTISNGTYSGRFIYRSQNMAYQYKEAAVTLMFNGSVYSSSSGANYYPAGGSGNYSIINDSKITFTDINFWTANFDGNLILNGDYAYHYEGDSLVISKNITSLASYEYRIKKN